MTTDTTASRKERRDLRELAKTINDQFKQLSNSVAEVRQALYDEASELRKQYRALNKARAKPRLIDPITVFHANGVRSTAPGHDCTEPPCQPDALPRGARITSAKQSPSEANGAAPKAWEGGHVEPHPPLSRLPLPTPKTPPTPLAAPIPFPPAS